jgi:hypothetical protein
MSEITTISNARMEAFIDTISEQARTALHERLDDILKAWHENIEEAQEAEKKFPPLKLSIAATVDLENNNIETVLSFTAKYQSKISQNLPDPEQPQLPGLAEAFNANYAEASLQIGNNPPIPISRSKK